MDSINAKELAGLAVRSLDKHKAGDLRVIGVAGLTVIADYFVIASGTSTTQVKSLADYVEQELGEQGLTPLRTEGYAAGNWIVADYGTVIVHIFCTETRRFYDLERLWKDGKSLPPEEFLEKAD